VHLQALHLSGGPLLLQGAPLQRLLHSRRLGAPHLRRLVLSQRLHMTLHTLLRHEEVNFA